eukprot:scaffold421272_cov70-Attheya_sp.AAC.1
MSKASLVVVGGRLLRGIPRMVVIPPAAAARFISFATAVRPPHRTHQKCHRQHPNINSYADTEEEMPESLK